MLVHSESGTTSVEMKMTEKEFMEAVEKTVVTGESARSLLLPPCFGSPPEPHGFKFTEHNKSDTSGRWVPCRNRIQYGGGLKFSLEVEAESGPQISAQSSSAGSSSSGFQKAQKAPEDCKKTIPKKSEDMKRIKDSEKVEMQSKLEAMKKTEDVKVTDDSEKAKDFDKPSVKRNKKNDGRYFCPKAVVPTEKTSERCAKCYRTSMYTEKAKEATKLAKLVSKQYKEKADALEVIINKKDVELVELKQQLETQTLATATANENLNEEIKNREIVERELRDKNNELAIRVQEMARETKILSESIFSEQAETVNVNGIFGSMKEDFKILTNQLQTIQLENENIKELLREVCSGSHVNPTSYDRLKSHQAPRPSNIPIGTKPGDVPEPPIPDVFCVLCLKIREQNEDVVGCAGCSLLYHEKCFYEWLNTSPMHFLCPTCNAKKNYSQPPAF
uniref:RING-type domain-containing protein n=1 Tax=Caenorhabditis tropicalis TaxID=1561998 RepID=A0A1I7UPT2_9PELO